MEIDKETGKIILRCDSSAIKEGGCDFRFKSIVVDGLVGNKVYNDTLYGTAVHAYMARMEESGGKFDDAVRQAMLIFRNPNIVIREKKEHLTENHLILTCFDFWQHIEKNSNFELFIDPQATCYNCKGAGHIQTQPEVFTVCSICNGNKVRPQPIVEKKFSIKYYEDDKFIVYIEGTIDRIGKIKNGCLCVRDYKTTSSWDSVKFLKSFKSSAQLKLYIWSLKKLGLLFPDGPLAPFAKQPVGVAIDGIFLKSKKETTFEGSEVFIFKDTQMDEFEVLLAKEIYRIMALALGTIAPDKNGKMRGLCYPGYFCKFFDICHAQDEIVAEFVKTKNFKQKDYKPLQHGEYTND